MNTRRLVAALLTVALLGSSGWSVAADSRHAPVAPRSGTHDPSMMDGAMMGGGGMMKSCPMMMGQLPPGNAKLAMQMHGEMMKAMGDIMLKYADRIPTPSSK